MNDIIKKITSTKSKIIEYYTDDTQIYPELTIPEFFDGYISDLNINNLILPNNLCILDLFPSKHINLNFNMPSNLQDIIIRDANIINKTVVELFPKNIRYRYVNCLLNGIPLNICINNIYFKYFQKYPTYHNKACYQPLNHIIYYKFHNVIIDDIIKYRESMAKSREFTLTIQQDLIANVWHPDRVEKIINQFGIDFLDTL